MAKKDEFWSDGAFIESVSGESIAEKMNTFHKKHNEDITYECRKCEAKISAHNRDWHDSLCDDCFDRCLGE